MIPAPRTSARLASMLLGMALGCGAQQQPLATGSDDPRCRGGLLGAARSAPVATAEVPAGPVVDIVVEGLLTVPAELVDGVVELPIGESIDPSTLRADILRLLALEVFEDVEAHADEGPEGVTVRYRVFERPLLAEVRVVGSSSPPAVRLMPGEVYSPQRLARERRRLLADLVRDGYSEAEVQVHAWRPRAERVGVCLAISPGRHFRVGHVAVHGAERVDEQDIFALLDGFEGRVNVPGGVYRADLLSNALQHVTAFYYDRGMLDVTIQEPSLTWQGDELSIDLEVVEGPVYRVGIVTLAGTPRASTEEHLRLLDIEPEEVFSRTRFMAVVERMKALEHRLRGEDITVLPQVDMDRERHLVDVELVIGERAAPEQGMAAQTPAEPEFSLGAGTLSFDASLGPLP